MLYTMLNYKMNIYKEVNQESEIQAQEVKIKNFEVNIHRSIKI